MDNRELIDLDRRVPRYTSYPTAPHFHPGVGADVYGAWLEALEAESRLSLYLHLPFCDSLCWFCGCNTTVVNRYEPVAAYVADLDREIAIVTDRLGGGRPLHHVHFGGGSPSILRRDDIQRLGARVRGSFALAAEAEIAVELDPRGLDEGTVAAFAAIGVNRASVGLQDINPRVQEAINRIQPPASNRRAVAMLRDAGIAGLNVDLIYGLPFQDEDCIARTVDHALALAPDRVALFGYAHVPGMKRHQQLIPTAALPDGAARLGQAARAAAMLVAAGYRRIGLDHFVRPGDAMERAFREGALRRNFQGYTTDGAEALVGIGASAIGALPQGYVQNVPTVPGWRQAVRDGRLPVARGIALDADDRLRRAVIESLMCYLEADLAGLAWAHGSAQRFTDELDRLEPWQDRGLLTIDGGTLRVTEAGRPFVRLVAAVFDARLAGGEARHSQAV